MMEIIFLMFYGGGERMVFIKKKKWLLFMAIKELTT